MSTIYLFNKFTDHSHIKYQGLESIFTNLFNLNVKTFVENWTQKHIRKKAKLCRDEEKKLVEHI